MSDTNFYLLNSLLTLSSLLKYFILQSYEFLSNTAMKIALIFLKQKHFLYFKSPYG